MHFDLPQCMWPKHVMHTTYMHNFLSFQTPTANVYRPWQGVKLRLIQAPMQLNFLPWRPNLAN